MFRALVQGMALNKRMNLNSPEEDKEADHLRFAVMDAICRSDKRRASYVEALIAITVEESLKRFYQECVSQPVIVYIPESEAKQGERWGTGYVSRAEYGAEFAKPGKNRIAHKHARLLCNGSNYYDLYLF